MITTAHEKPAMTVGLNQDGLRGQPAHIYDPDNDFVVDDSLVPAEFTDGTPACHGQDVVIADDTPNVYGALIIYKPGEPNNTVTLPHYLLAVPTQQYGTLTPAEFRCFYEYLGLTRPWIAQYLNVDEADVRGWEDGTDPIPVSAATELKGLARVADELVHKLATDLQAGGVMTTYRTDAQFRAADPFGLTYPASWHRAVAARVADRTPTTTIDYRD